MRSARDAGPGGQLTLSHQRVSGGPFVTSRWRAAHPHAPGRREQGVCYSAGPPAIGSVRGAAIRT